jgi:hypothetical protein
LTSSRPGSSMIEELLMVEEFDTFRLEEEKSEIPES